MSRIIISPLSTRSSFVGRAATAHKHAILRADAAVLAAIVLACIVVGLSTLLTDSALWRAAALGAFVGVQTVVFAFELAPFLAFAVLVAGYVVLVVSRWDVTLILSLLCATIAIGSHIHHTHVETF